LLRNAIKFASKGGVITITTDVITKQADADGTVGGEERGQVVIVKIKDNGTGIAANILPKLYKICYYLLRRSRIRTICL
jgi:signal transduction histidine kinase